MAHTLNQTLVPKVISQLEQYANSFASLAFWLSVETTAEPVWLITHGQDSP